MFRKIIVGCALVVALAAGTISLASPPTRAIPINNVTMQSQTVTWSSSAARFGAVKTLIADPRNVDVVSSHSTVTTHMLKETTKSRIPQVLAQRVYTPKINVNPVQKVQFQR